MSGPRASGSQTCKPSFALLRHEVAPRADKSIRVHERHDNRRGRSPPDAFSLVARTRYGSATSGMSNGPSLRSPRESQTRWSRAIARPSHHVASHVISAVAPRFVPKSVPNNRTRGAGSATTIKRGPWRDREPARICTKLAASAHLFRELPVLVAHLDDPSSASRHQIVGRPESHDVGVVIESPRAQHGGGTLGDAALS